MSRPRDCVPVLRDHDLHGMARWASERPVRFGWRGRTCRDLWDASPRGSWLLLYAERAGAARRDLVRAAAACVRPALRFVPGGEDRPRLAIEAAERWADEPTQQHMVGWLRASNEALDAEWKMGRTGDWVGRSVAEAAAAAGAGPVGSDFMATSFALEHAHVSVGGQKASAEAHRACADAVRRLVPFLDLGAGS